MFKQWQIPEGNGSGVIWDKEGHIVTNYHGKITSIWYPSALVICVIYSLDPENDGVRSMIIKLSNFWCEVGNQFFLRLEA